MTDEPETPISEIRDQNEVALRALAVYLVWCVAINYSDRKTYFDWIKKSNLTGLFSENEIAFLKANPASKQQIINMSWRCEGLLILLWCLSLTDRLPDADTLCDTRMFSNLLPPLNSSYVSDFLSKVTLRSEGEVSGLSEQIIELHWKARDAKINKTTPDEPINIGVVQERHHAINWVLAYCGLGWDDMVCDT